MESNACDICEILPSIPDEYVLERSEYWQVNIAHLDQTLLGRTYIGLRRHAFELDELTMEEEYELIRLRNGLFGALRRSFEPITFNTSCLKNDAFKAAPDDTPSEAAHVHWHVMPRYDSRPIEVNGEVFTDPSPGRYLDSDRPRHRPTPETAAKIAEIIRSNW